VGVYTAALFLWVCVLLSMRVGVCTHVRSQ